MNEFSTYQLFLKSAVFVLLVGQLYTATASYCCLMFDIDSENIELLSTVDGESEEDEKEENKLEKENKIQPEGFMQNLMQLYAKNDMNHTADFPVPPHPEITTPPPKLYPS